MNDLTFTPHLSKLLSALIRNGEHLFVKLLFLLLFLYNSVFLVSAQSFITGKIVDDINKPLFAATVSLLKAKDSSAIKFSISSKDGSYSFLRVTEGEYLISVSCVSFQNKFSSSFSYQGGAQVIPSIILARSKKSLGAVTVRANRPFIEMQLDKMVVNVDASPTNVGANVLEVLAKSPFIGVNMDDNISLNGKQGVLILLDGKRTYLSSKDLAALLKSIPSSSIDQIEIMTVPPAKYEAEGMAGVINIKTKKNKSDGFNGNFTTTAEAAFFIKDGKTYVIPNTQNNLNFNYKKNKVTLYGATGFNRYNGRGFSTFNKTYYTSDGTVNGYNYIMINQKFSGNYAPLNLGVDYRPGKKNIIGIAASTILMSSSRQSRERMSQVQDGNAQVLIKYTAYLNHWNNFNKTTGNVNWKHTLDTLGQEFSVDADYVRYDSPSNEELVTIYNTGPSSPLSHLNNTAQTSTAITAFKGDYSRPLKKGRIEAGFKSSFVHTKLDNEYFRLLNNKWESQPGLKNHFSYNENISAVYLNINKQIKKWSLQTGLRIEIMEAKGKQTLTNTGFYRKNTELFPSISASYNINKNNTTKLSFSRRISRPQYYALMPYLSLVDTLDVWHGNPYLKPEFSNRMEAGYELKSRYFFTLSYTVIYDVIRYIAAQIGTQQATEFYPVNIDKLKNISLTVSSPLKAAKWWDVNIFTSLYGNKYYNFNNGAESKFYITLNQNITNTFKLSKSLKGELMISYTTKSIDQLGDNVARLDNFLIGLSQQILKDKGNLIFSIRDPFQWNKYNSKNHFIRLYEESTYRYGSRSLRLSFNYRFGKVNNQSRQRTTASQEEQNR